jgi:hypothetical protein
VVILDYNGQKFQKSDLVNFEKVKENWIIMYYLLTGLYINFFFGNFVNFVKIMCRYQTSDFDYQNIP